MEAHSCRSAGAIQSGSLPGCEEKATRRRQEINCYSLIKFLFPSAPSRSYPHAHTSGDQVLDLAPGVGEQST